MASIIFFLFLFLKVIFLLSPYINTTKLVRSVDLTHVHNNNNNNNGTERKISHLLYMDDLKLLGRNENILKNEMKIVQTISKDINMNLV